MTKKKRRRDAKTFLFTAPPDWINAFEDHADSLGKTMSEWISDCCRAKLPAEVRKQLSERKPANRPKKNPE